MKVSKGVLIGMRSRRNTGNVYKLLGNIVIGDVVSFESYNDVMKVIHM